MNYAKIEQAMEGIRHPWIKRVAKRLLIVDGTARFPTMATDGKHLFINALYLESLPLFEVIAVFVHEALHVIMRHPLRRNGRDPRKWNIACDHAINYIVTRLGYHLPGNGLEGIDNSAELIYGDVEQMFDQQMQQHQQDQQDQQDDQQDSGSSEQDSGSSESAQDNEDGADDSGNDDTDDDAESTDGGESTAADGQTDDEGDSSEPVTGSGGNVGNPYDDDGVDLLDYPLEDGQTMADAERELDTMLAKAKLDTDLSDEEVTSERERDLMERKDTNLHWPTELEEYLNVSGAGEYSLNPPHAIFMQQGIICNQLNPSGVGHVVLAVDVSLSIDVEKLHLVITHLQTFVENIDYESLRIITCDNEVRWDETFDRGVPVDWDDLLENGITKKGTKFQPIFELLEEEGTTPDLLIYFTDLEANNKGNQYNDDPGYPVVWLLDHDEAFDGNGNVYEPKDRPKSSRWYKWGWKPTYGAFIDATK